MNNDLIKSNEEINLRMDKIESKLDSILDLLTQFKVHGPWQEHELEYIKEHYDSKKTCDIAHDLKRSISSVYEVVRKMNLNKKTKRLTDEQRLYVVENFKTMKYADLAKEVGLSASALKTQIHKMREQGLMSYKFSKNRKKK